MHLLMGKVVMMSVVIPKCHYISGVKVLLPACMLLRVCGILSGLLFMIGYVVETVVN